jgi:hypothetical protein
MPQAAYCYMRVVGRGSYGEVTLVKHRRDGKQVGDLGPGRGDEGRDTSRASSNVQARSDGQGLFSDKRSASQLPL